MEEEPLQFERTINKMHLMFRVAGIYITTGISKASDHFITRCIYIFNILCANLNLFGSICWCIDGVKNGQDFLEITYSAPCISLSFMAQFKGLFLVLNEKLLQKLINNIRKLEKKGTEGKQYDAKILIAEKETKFLNYVLKTLSILYMCLVTGFSLSPIMFTVLKYYQTKEVDLFLPFFVLYPFDPFELKYWPFSYIYQLWSECVVSLDICAADFFFFTCCTYIRIQFRLLRHDLENIIPKEGNSNKKFIEDEEFENNFKELIKWHQDLIELSNILEIIYSKSTLLNFISSSLIICLTGFNVTMVNDVAIVMTFLSFLFMGLVQVFFLCFFADLLMSSVSLGQEVMWCDCKSMEISDAIYNSRWYMAEAKVVKKLLLVQTRSQDPCKLTASGFANVNLNCFMRVLSTAWSYFALLQTMYSD